MVQVCDEEYNCHYDYVCEPEYYVTQYSQPNWNLYQNGDEVDIHFYFGQPVSWYVTPASDPGRDGDYAVVCSQGQCHLFQYPY